jgi:hypothetical protein
MDEKKNNVKMCQNCGKREATECWVGEGGVLALVHNMSQSWCKICCIEAQLEYAKKIANKIPDLEKELEELKNL